MVGPWPDVATARLFLGQLARRTAAGEAVDTAVSPPATVTTANLANWLAAHELAPLAYHHCQDADPALAEALRT